MTSVVAKATTNDNIRTIKSKPLSSEQKPNMKYKINTFYILHPNKIFTKIFSKNIILSNNVRYHNPLEIGLDT